MMLTSRRGFFTLVAFVCGLVACVATAAALIVWQQPGEVKGLALAIIAVFATVIAAAVASA